MDLARIIAMRLRKAREDRGLTLAEAAEAGDLPVDYLAGCEAAEKEILFDEAIRLATVYEVSLYYLAAQDMDWVFHYTADGEVELIPRKEAERLRGDVRETNGS